MKTRKALAETQVAIVGLGLMGGSMAMALRNHCGRLLGCDIDQDTLRLAKQGGLIDQAESDVKAVLPGTDVIILATPVSKILELLQLLPELHAEPMVVLDLGSTKDAILRAMSELPPSFDPIGGHPVCGKETSGLKQASADLYQGAPFVLTPLPRTTHRARSLAQAIVTVVNARLLWMEPETHDVWVAVTSHLPYLLAVALVGATPPEASPVIGPGFRGASRLAEGSPRMMADIFVTNRGPVLKAISMFAEQLDELKTVIQEGDAMSLEARFEASVQQRRKMAMPPEGR